MATSVRRREAVGHERCTNILLGTEVTFCRTA